MPDQDEGTQMPRASRNIFFEFKMLRWFVVLWLGAVLLWGLAIPTGLQPPFPGSKIALVALMGIHGAGYWLILTPGMKKKSVAALLVGQVVLFTVICLVSLNMQVFLCLYLTLAGTIILSFSEVQKAILAALGCLLAGIPAYLFFSTYVGAGAYILIFVPMVVFLLAAVLIYTQQVHAQTRTQNLLDELAESHLQLEAYATQVKELTLANERQRMARELHDTLAQGLAGIILQLEAIDSRLTSGKIEQVQTIVRQAMTRARSALAESRQVIDHLRKETSASPIPLSSAIQEEVDRFSASTGIPVALNLDIDVPIPFPLRDCASRAVAEALLNIARHAAASQAWVNLVASTGELRIEIRDNGAGFTPLNKIGQVGHYGLLGLRERARLLGGTLEVTSAPQQGTNIHICLPLDKEVENE